MMMNGILATVLLVLAMVLPVMSILMVKVSMRNLVRHCLCVVSALMFLNDQFRPVSEQ